MPNTHHQSIVAMLAAILSLMACSSLWAKPLEPVTLQLKWRHQFQFAGYYAAKEKGFYEEEGLDVSILEATPGQDPVKKVVNGEAEFGVGTSELILNKARGDAVKVLGVVFQHSPLSLIATQASGIDTVHGLAGKELMIEHNSAELFAYLRCEGLTDKAFKLREHSFDTQDLLNNTVDAMSVYITDELFELETAGVKYIVFTPRMCGIDFYGDNFFTMKSTLLSSPKMVKAFRRATIKGWQYAMNNIEELIDIILERYSTRHSDTHLRYEARKMLDLMQPELIEPGYMNMGRWNHIVNTYQSLGLLDKDFDVESMLYIDPSTKHQKQLKVLLGFGGGILGISLLVLFTIGYFYRQMQINSSRLRTMFEHAPFSLIVLDQSYNIQSWNNHAKHTFLWHSDDVLGKNLIELLVPKPVQSNFRESLDTVLTENRAVRMEDANLRKDGEEIVCEWINAPFHDQKNQQRFIMAMARDISVRRRLEEELEIAAHYDGLTSLANRTLILDSLKRALATARRMNKKVALLFIDLDDFKKVNDTYGHNMGDKLLVVIAQRLEESVRASDYIGRLAGDEFLMILQDVNGREDAEILAEKIAQTIAEPCHIEDALIHITASIGVSIFPEDAIEIDELIQASDQDMYSRKEKHNH